MSALSGLGRRAPVPSGRLFPLVAAPALGVLTVAEAQADPEFRAQIGSFVVVALWTAGAFAVAAWLPSVGAALVAVLYPLETAIGIHGPNGSGLIAVLLAVGWAGYADPPRRSLAGVSVAVLTFIATDATRHGLSLDTVFFPMVFYPGRWAGVLVQRERRRSAEVIRMAALLEEQRAAAEHAAVTEERSRIAREIHDAVAHSVSVMTLQVGGLRRQLADVLEQRPAERDVMLGIERLGRQSVEELRSLVGILREAPEGRDDATHLPSLARAEALVADVRAAGLPVELTVAGDTGEELPRGLDAAAYRILQEALTNVLRHAPGARTRVLVRHGHEAVDLEVDNEQPRSAPPHADGVGGHGLVGMRERAALFGGRVEAGERADGGYAVRVHLPRTTWWQ
jgi:signal transduction histidine kinase